MAEAYRNEAGAIRENLAVTRNNAGETIAESHRGYENEEKKALVLIYESLVGTEWTKNGRWLTNPEPHTWSGVVLDQRGRVTKIMLPNNKLQGRPQKKCFTTAPQNSYSYTATRGSPQ